MEKQNINKPWHARNTQFCETENRWKNIFTFGYFLQIIVQIFFIFSEWPSGCNQWELMVKNGRSGLQPALEWGLINILIISIFCSNDLISNFITLRQPPWEWGLIEARSLLIIIGLNIRIVNMSKRFLFVSQSPLSSSSVKSWDGWFCCERIGLHDSTNIKTFASR